MFEEHTSDSNGNVGKDSGDKIDWVTELQNSDY